MRTEKGTFKKGTAPWNKGKKGVMPPSWNKGLKGYMAGPNHHWSGRNQTDDKGATWKGDEVGYRQLHTWVQNKLGKPRFCEACRDSSLRPRQYHWANKSRTYQRNLTDWVRLCAKCHQAYDRNELVIGLF